MSLKTDRLWHKLKYRNDPEYRAKALARAKRRNEINKADPQKRRLLLVYNKIQNERAKIERASVKIRDAKNRISHLIREKEELQLILGKQRAEKKKLNKCLSSPTISNTRKTMNLQQVSGSGAPMPH